MSDSRRNYRSGMVSDDLVKRARHNALADMPHYASVELIEAMADRIEELDAERAENRIDARLSHFAAELRKEGYFVPPTVLFRAWENANTTLAEVKGENQ